MSNSSPSDGFHPDNDPGLGEKYEGRTKRVINKNGSFNMKREGLGFSLADSYQYLVQLSWFRFIALLVAVYFALNSLFALLYVMGGVGHITGASTTSFSDTFLSAFFFSVQTFTTVGYGAMAPVGVYTNFVAAVEAMTGLLAFALATGLLYGRFSKPNARILFSDKALITPMKDMNSLQFRMVNQRSNVLMNMKAVVMLSILENSQGSFNRRYHQLPLETSRISFFPLNWTLVHLIDKESPLYGKSQKDLEKLEAELLILIEGFDDAFSQMVHRRYSYRFDELVWGAKFVKAFHINEEGDVIMDVRQIHAYEKVPMNG